MASPAAVRPSSAGEIGGKWGGTANLPRQIALYGEVAPDKSLPGSPPNKDVHPNRTRARRKERSEKIQLPGS